MKISTKWLREILAAGGAEMSSKPAAEIGEKLTLHACELEEVLDLNPFFSRVFAGKMLETRPHSNAEKLSVATFDLGKKLGKKQIIYGQVHEVAVGEVLPIALGGAKLKSGIEIKNTEIRGEKSEGMIADNAELGLKMLGLLRFADAEIGKSLPEICAEFGDQMLEIDNKSLTHRPDLMGHNGFAREVAAIFRADWNLVEPSPKLDFAQQLKAPRVEIQSPVCRRFCALQMHDVSVAPSSFATQIRLENLGIRAISNFVDITNLILAGRGQPMHVFDADKIDGKIIVRQAKKGEKITTLDGNEYELDDEICVIADEKKVLSIAGIMGGLESSCTEKTQNIVFECANFDPVSIRRSSQKLGIRTESSMRYEKSLDPHACRSAILAAGELGAKVCEHARFAGALTDVFPAQNEFEPKYIDFDPQKISTHTGLEISDDEIVGILHSLKFEVERCEKSNWRVQIPSFRATKDISIPEDLTEEVVRMHGFESLPAKLPEMPICPPERNFQRDLEWQIRDFCAGRGFLEVLQYSFASARDCEFDPTKKYVEIQNPLSADQQFLRTNLVAAFARNTESELRKWGSLRFFEIGKTFLETGKVLPDERQKWAFFAAEMGGKNEPLFFELKKNVADALHFLGLHSHFFESQTPEVFAEKGTSADIFCGEEKVGIIAALEKSRLSVRDSAAVFAELDVQKITQLVRKTLKKYEKISPFPPVFRDLSIVLESKIGAGAVEIEAQKSSELLQKIEFFDEFTDEAKLGRGQKNISFHLQFRSGEKTLAENEVEHEFAKIVKNLEKKFGAQLRLDFDRLQKSAKKVK